MMMCDFRWLMMAGLLATVSGCEPKSAPTTPKVTSEDLQRDVGKAINTTAEYSQQAKEEFQKKLADRLTELDADFARLREKGRDLKDDAKVKWDERMADLEAKRLVAKARLAEVNDSTAEAWKDIQQGAQSAWEELDQAFRKAANEF